MPIFWDQYPLSYDLSWEQNRALCFNAQRVPCFPTSLPHLKPHHAGNCCGIPECRGQPSPRSQACLQCAPGPSERVSTIWHGYLALFVPRTEALLLGHVWWPLNRFWHNNTYTLLNTYWTPAHINCTLPSHCPAFMCLCPTQTSFGWRSLHLPNGHMLLAPSPSGQSPLLLPGDFSFSLPWYISSADLTIFWSSITYLCFTCLVSSSLAKG